MRPNFNRTVDWFMRSLGTPTALGLAALTVVLWKVEAEKAAGKADLARRRS